MLAVVGISYFLGFDRTWVTHLRMLHFRTEQSARARLKVKVWVNKSTGIYYCPASTLYGRPESGSLYMDQGDALQVGYHPSLDEPCQ